MLTAANELLVDHSRVVEAWNLPGLCILTGLFQSDPAFYQPVSEFTGLLGHAGRSVCIAAIIDRYGTVPADTDLLIRGIPRNQLIQYLLFIDDCGLHRYNARTLGLLPQHLFRIGLDCERLVAPCLML